MRSLRACVPALLLCLAATTPVAAASIGFTVAGGGGGDGGPAIEAAVDPWQVAALGSTVYVASVSQSTVRRIGSDGVIRAVAGNYLPRPTGDPMPALGQVSPALGTRLARDVTCAAAVSADEVYFAAGNTIQLAQGGTLRTVLSGTAADGSAAFREVGGCLVVGPILYVSTDREVLACALPVPRAGCSPVVVLTDLRSPRGLAMGAGQILYVAERLANRVIARQPNGSVAAFAGGGTQLGDGGPATAANLERPEGLAYDAQSGDLYIADAGNFLVRRVDLGGIITSVAGTGAQNFTSNWIVPAQVGGDLLRVPMTPTGLAVTSDRRLWIASQGRLDVLPLAGGAPGATPSPTAVAPAQSCDITGNGSVTTVDAVRVLQFVAGQQSTCP